MHRCNYPAGLTASRWLPTLCLPLLAALWNNASALEATSAQLYLVADHQLPGLRTLLNERLFPTSNKSIRRVSATSQRQFFDYPDLRLLQQGNYIAVEIFAHDSARDLGMVTVHGGSGPTDFGNRGQGKVVNADDKHALMSRVKRTDRVAFRARLASIGVVNPLALRPVASTHSEHFSYVLNAVGTDHMTGNLNLVNSRVLGREAQFATLSILSHTEQGQDVAARVREELKRIFPQLRQTTSNAYQLAHANGPGSPRITAFIMGHPMLFKLAQALLYATLGGLILLLVIRRGSRSDETTESHA